MSQELHSKADKIIQEIYTKQLFIDIAKDRLVNLKGYKEGASLIIQKLKSVFSAFYVIPEEVWVEIFLLCVHYDAAHFFASSGATRARNTALILSQVYSPWRRIVRAESGIWCNFMSTSSQLTSTSQMECWKQFLSVNPGSIDLTINCASSSLVTPPSSLGPHPAVYAQLNSLHLLICDNNLPNIDALPREVRAPLILHLKQVPTTEFFDKINHHFSLITNLTIISSENLPCLSPAFNHRSSPISTLKLDLTTFDDIGIGYYSNLLGVRELHIRHKGICTLQKYPAFESENLTVLGITPPDVVWIELVKLPVLHRLILYGPRSQTLEALSLASLVQHPDFHRVHELELQDWSRYTPANGASWTIIPLVLEIRDSLRMVEIIRCVDSFIEGECLVALVRLLKDTNANSIPSRLTTVVIDSCTGITRRDCEQIATLVEKLVVRV